MKLDTSLKRHTSLLTRFRSSLHTPTALAGILKDIDALSLEKYVDEAVGGVEEGLIKCKSGAEISGAVDVRLSWDALPSDSVIDPLTLA